MRTARAAAVVTCLILAVGCTKASDGASGGGGGDASPSAAGKQTGQISVKITPSDGDRKVAPNKPVKVTITGGEVVSVSVKGKGGGKVTGKTSDDRSSWESAGTLRPSTSYTVKVDAKNDGGDKSASASFTTLTPKATVKALVAPLNGSVVGVGQPIAVYLTKPVKDRAAVERALHVKTSREVEGSWRWFSDKEVHYRPDRKSVV